MKTQFRAKTSEDCPVWSCEFDMPGDGLPVLCLLQVFTEMGLGWVSASVDGECVIAGQPPLSMGYLITQPTKKTHILEVYIDTNDHWIQGELTVVISSIQPAAIKMVEVREVEVNP